MNQSSLESGSSTSSSTGSSTRFDPFNSDGHSKIKSRCISNGISLLQDKAAISRFIAFQPDALFIDGLFIPSAYLSHLLGVPLITFSQLPAPMPEVLFGINQPADEVGTGEEKGGCAGWMQCHSLLQTVFMFC